MAMLDSFSRCKMVSGILSDIVCELSKTLNSKPPAKFWRFQGLGFRGILTALDQVLGRCSAQIGWIGFTCSEIKCRGVDAQGAEVSET